MIHSDSAVFRVVLIGDSSVGKTCIVNRFLYNAFDSDQNTTIGASYQSYSRDEGGSHIELQIWDTAGQERYRSLGPVYYRDSAAALVVFDVTNRASFENLDEWISNFRDAAGEDAQIFVLGNKIDLVDSQKVSINEAQSWCTVRGLSFTPTSAKTTVGIMDLFDNLIAKLAGSAGVRARAPIYVFQNPPPKECC
jgi:small GTP-binding protein